MEKKFLKSAILIASTLVISISGGAYAERVNDAWMKSDLSISQFIDSKYRIISVIPRDNQLEFNYEYGTEYTMLSEDGKMARCYEYFNKKQYETRFECFKLMIEIRK